MSAIDELNPTILTMEDLEGLHGVIAIDFETTGVDPYHDEPLGLGIWAEDAGVIGFLPTYTEDDLQQIAHYMIYSWAHDSHVLAHNLKFEWHWLRANEILLQRFKWFDTQIAEQLLNEEYFLDLESTETRRLKTRTKKRLLELAKPFGGISKAEKWPMELLAEYCINDCRVTYEIARKQVPKLKAERLTGVLSYQHRYLKEIFRIERRGLFFDIQAGKQTEKHISQLVKSGERKLVETLRESGLDYTKPPTYTSPQQLSRLLYSELELERPQIPEHLKGSPKAKAYNTKTGTAKELLQQLDHPAVRIIEELRKVRKIGSYLKAYHKLGVPEGDGLVMHSSFNITGTKTGRLSSSGPNLQQVSDKSVGELLLAEGDEPLRLRRVFRARPGFKLVSIDYKQMEIVAFAMIANEPAMLKVIEGGGDVHQGVAEMMFGSYDPEKRRVVKALNFGLLYGLGVGAMATDLGMPLPQVKELFSKYQSTFKRIRPYFREVEKQLRETGYVRYWSGRKRRISNPNFHYRGVNSIVQGGTAEIIARAVIRIGPYLRKKHQDDAHIVAIIHDELLLEIRDELVEKLVPRIQKIMAVPDLLGRPFATDAEWGTYWSLPEN